jgi:hypothetical protein
MVKSCACGGGGAAWAAASERTAPASPANAERIILRIAFPPMGGRDEPGHDGLEFL